MKSRSLTDFVISLIVLIRPRHWIKNLALFVSIFLSGHLFESDALVNVAKGFVIFCLLSSSSYIINDILDAPYDRKHPFKKDRPIARREITEGMALTLAILLGLVGLIGADYINTSFLAISFIYLILRYANSIVLRHIAIVDILTLAAGYILRVYAGIAASGYYISIWLLLAILSLSLLISIGKRRAELNLLEKGYKDQKGNEMGSIFHGRYSERMVNTYTAMFATATFITYTYYTFLVNFELQGFFFPSVTIADIYFFCL